MGLNLVGVPDDVTVLDVISFKPEEQLGSFFERPLQVYTTTVTGGTVAAIPLDTSIFSLWKVLPTVAPKLRGFKYFRGNLKITVTYAGSPQALGTFGMAFHPIAGTTDTNGGSTVEVPSWFSTGGDAFRATKMSLPHFMLPLEQTDTKTLLLPFPSASPYIPISNGNDYAFAPINLNTYSNIAGTAVQPITVRMFASYTDVELYTPLVPQSGNDETNPTLSTVLGYGASVLGVIGKVFPIVTPWSKMVGAASGVARALGFSRPPVIAFPSYFSFVGTNLSFMSGAPDQSVRLALDPASAVDVSGKMVPLADSSDGDIMEILTKPGLVLADATISAAAGYIQVIPSTAMGGNLAPFGGVYWERIPLNLATHMFRSYSGGIDVYVEFIANSFLKANVMLWIIPAGSVYPTSVTDSPYLRRALVSVVGRTVVKIHVPYSGAAPFTSTRAATTLSVTTSPAPGSIAALDYLGFQLIDPIVIGSTFVPTLKANFYYAAGEDFCVMNPCMENVRDTKMMVPLTTLYPESGEKEIAVGVSEVPQKGRVMKMRSLPYAIQGEQVVNFHELMKRTVFQANLSAPPTSDVISLNYAGPVPNGAPTYGAINGSFISPIGVTNVQWTFMTYLSSCYYGITGGVRYKFQTSNTTSPARAFLARGTEGEVVAGSGTAPYTTSFPDFSLGGAFVPGTNMLFEFEYPSRSIYPFREAWRNGSSTSHHSGANQPNCRVMIPVALNVPVLLFQSAADDTRLHKFLYVQPLSPMSTPLLLGREQTVDLMPALEEEEVFPTLTLSRS